MTGRRPSLTPAVADALVDALGAGLTYRDSAALARVSPSSVFAWLARGRAERNRVERGCEPNPDEAAHLEFLERLSLATAELAIEVNRCWLTSVRNGDWRAAAAWVERHHRNADDPVDRLDPEQAGEAAHVGFTEAQAQALAGAMRRFGESLLSAVEAEGIDVARSRQSHLARDALLPETVSDGDSSPGAA